MSKPDLQLEDGTRLIWDATSHTYVKAGEETDIERSRNHSSGGDNDLFPEDQTQLAQNPLGEGILASKAEDEDEDGIESDLWEDVLPDVRHIDGLPSKVPTPNQYKRDPSFPSRVGADLDSCPECSGHLMFDDHGERACAACGTRQPILKLTRRSPRMAFVAPLIAALPEMLGIGGAAAAGAEGAAAGAAGSSGLLGTASRLMPMAQSAHALTGGSGDKQPDPVIEPDGNLQTASVRTADDTGDWFADKQDTSRADSPDGEETQENAQEYGDAPELLKDAEEGGHSDRKSPNDEENNYLSSRSAAVRLGLELDAPADHGALEAFSHSLPLVVMYATSEKDGTGHPVLEALDQMLEMEFPGYKEADHDDHGLTDEILSALADKPAVEVVDEDLNDDLDDEWEEVEEGDSDEDSDSNDSDESHDKKEAHVIHEARKPKMCPYHKDLVEYSLQTDPQTALSALPPAGYGDAWCNSKDFESKCNFKPIMVTQKYWDDKQAEAELRREQREQELTAETPETPEAISEELDFIPADSAVDYTSEDTPAVSLVPAEAPSAVGGLEVAAHTAVIADVHGTPLSAGEYRMISSGDHVPEQITVEKVDKDGVTFINHTSGLEFRDRLSEQEILNSALKFEKTAMGVPVPPPAGSAQAAPVTNANEPLCPHGQQPETCPECQNAAMQQQNQPGMAPGTPLPTATAAVIASHFPSMPKEAGYNYTSQEQREFVDEPGVARNASKLEIDDVPHYAGLLDEDSISSSFLF